MASFASELRRQLAAAASGSRKGPRRGRSPERVAELAGLVDAAGRWDGSGVSLHTGSAAVARSAVRLWRSEFGLYPAIHPRKTPRANFGRVSYVVRAEGNRAVQAGEELRAARTSPALSRPGPESGRGTAYLRGAFQGAGSVTRPDYRRGHHLEFVHASEEFVRRVAALSRAPLKVVRRRDRWVAYTKSADGVTTLLSQLGLHEAVLEYEARAVLGEAKANANRVTNFDAANAGRTALSAARQQEALESISPEGLPAALREMLELRLEYPDAPLSELAQLGGLTKSAANHRLRRLVELASGKAPAPEE